MELYSRKQIREKLKVSDACLRRWIKTLGVECHIEILPNGVESKKVTAEDFLKLVEHGQKMKREEPSSINSELNILNSLQMEVTNLRTEKLFHSKLLQEKELYIDELKSRSQLAEERVDVMYAEIKKLNEELLKEKSKGFFQRIFS